MITIALAFLNKYIAYLRWGLLLGSWVVVAWSVHHIDVLSVKAAQADHIQTIVKSIPEVITKTQTITRIIHDSPDKCVDSPMPLALIEQLH